uniref:Uncharacterized protein n=1 Tax=Arsenophonus endosymbiont of Trialeurodes vaporariorum TaxID=235567 RepID=A0A3B0M350_9GAMM
MREIEAEGTLSSITACLNKVAADFQSIWFRCQPSYGHKLLPSIFRQGSSFGVAYHEKKCLKNSKDAIQISLIVTKIHMSGSR